MGLDNVLTFDMGGTTAKAALIEDGVISRSPEYEVGGALSIGHRLLKGGGYLLRVPSIDIAEVGAGGGSIANIDWSGALKVGPASAAASPGPACYKLGGYEPTVTDANVRLGFTNPNHLAGGALRLYPDLAEAAIRERISNKLGVDTTEAAWAIRRLTNASLARALRAVSIERGRDPKRFALFAFGGMGPSHALHLANELGIRKVVIPPLPGLFSAMGLLFAETEHHLIQTSYANISRPTTFGRLNDVITKLVNEALSTLADEGYGEASRSITLAADVRYIGQDHALTIQLPGRQLDGNLVTRLKDAFEAEYLRTYGYRSEGEEVQVVALRCIARGIPQRSHVPERLQLHASQRSHAEGNRSCYFGPEIGWVEVRVLNRAALTDQVLTGPAIVEEDNSLTVVLPGWRFYQDDWANIILEPAVAEE
jgi:N-methylhydantoinase A